MKKLKYIYNKQAFEPDMLGLFVNPFYFARNGLRKAMEIISRDVCGDLLDIGCGTKPYEKLFNVSKYVGLDIESSINENRSKADDFYDGNKFPYADSAFDVALCNQVLEHVFNPNVFLSEINRVLKPGGRLIMTVPFVWDEHEQPHDYARYSSYGLRFLLENNKFVILKYEKIGANATVLFQLINAYLYKIIKSWYMPLRLLMTITVMASINIFGIILSKVLPENKDLFLDHLVLAEKVR